jgi:nitrite reductase (NADH) small subunit
MSNWVRICAVGDCPPSEAREFVAGDRIVALFHVGGSFHALDGLCPHQGGPLGRGSLAGTVVMCPWHGWQFDVCSGQHQTNHALVHPRFAVRVQGDDILVNLDS